MQTASKSCNHCSLRSLGSPLLLLIPTLIQKTVCPGAKILTKNRDETLWRVLRRRNLKKCKLLPVPSRPDFAHHFGTAESRLDCGRQCEDSAVEMEKALWCELSIKNSRMCRLRRGCELKKVDWALQDTCSRSWTPCSPRSRGTEGRLSCSHYGSNCNS